MITEHKKEKYSNQKKKMLNIISHTEPIGIADCYSYKDIFNVF